MVNVRMLSRCLLAALVLCLAVGGAMAQGAPTVRMEPSTVRVGDVFQVRISSSQSLNVLSGLEKVEGPIQRVSGSGRESTISNGRSSVSFYWNFQATGTGAFTIGPFVVQAEGAEQTLPALTGIVGPAAVSADDVVRGTKGIVVNSQSRGSDPSPAIFTALEIPERVHYGEAFTVRTLLYIDSARIRRSLNLQAAPFPGNPAFARIDVDSWGSTRQNSTARSSVTINGRSYAVHVVSEELLAPIMSGKTTISGAELVLAAGFMEQFQFTSPSAEIEVLPLPEAPDDVVDVIVGKATVGASLDRSTVSERDAVTLVVRISGASWLESASLHDFPEIDGLETFDRDDERKYAVDSPSPLMTHVEISRTFRAVKPGEIVVPPLKFAVYDPATGEMTVQSTQPMALKVTPRSDTSMSIAKSDSSADPESQIDRKSARQIGDMGIMFIDTRPLEGGARPRGGTSLMLHPVFLGAHGIALGGAFAFWGFAARTRKLRGDVRLSHARSASKRADESLREAERLAGTETEPAPFYGALARSLLNGVAAVTGREASGLTADEADERLAACGAGTELRGRLKELLQKCDAMRYAPGVGSAGMQVDLDAARAALAEIGRMGK